MAKGICSVDGCGRDHYAQEMCALHYARLRRTGTVAARQYQPAAETFWTKVDKNGSLSAARPDLGQCWVWTAGATSGGYGLVSLGRGAGRRQAYVHRFAYEQVVERIPDGYHLDHLCRVTRCVNPDHLEPVTPAENKLRGVSPNAINARKTHCDHGHPFDAANTYIRQSGRRSCRTCNRLRARAAARGRAARFDGLS